MTQNQVEKSIITGNLQLSTNHKFTHYGVLLMSLALVVVPLYVISEKLILNKPLNLGKALFFFFLGILSALFFKWLQTKRLRFRKIVMSFPKDETFAIANKAIRKLEWKISSKDHNYIVAKVYNGWLSGGWGEQVTIIMNNDTIYINSICDPDKKSCLTSWGNNRKNVQKLINEMRTIGREHLVLTKT